MPDSTVRAPGSPYARNANGYPVPQPSTDDQSAAWTRNAAGWSAPQSFSAPQIAQWPIAPGTDPLPTAAVYSILDAPNGDQDQNGVIDLGFDLGLLPTANGPTTIGELGAPNGDQDQNGVIDLEFDLRLLPTANGPTTIGELSCPPSCYDEPVASNRSSSAVAEPATLSLLGLGMLAFAGLRRRAQRAGPANAATT